MSIVFKHDIPQKYKLLKQNYYLAIVGSRSIDDKFNVFDIIHKYVNYLVYKKNVHHDKIVIITGGAKGVDSIAEEYANRNGLDCLVIKPDWYKYKKRAGMLRNYNIVKYANSVLAIISNKSKGTLNSINIAKKKNIPCTVVNYEHYILEKYD